jgi:hypothetical protein
VQRLELDRNGAPRRGPTRALDQPQVTAVGDGYVRCRELDARNRNIA